MLEIIGGLTISAGVLGAWNARKLGACCLPSYQAAASVALKPPAGKVEETFAASSPTGEPAAALQRDEKQQGEAETAGDISIEKTQSCADDAAGPPGAQDAAAGTASPNGDTGPYPEEFQIGTFLNPEEDPKHASLGELGHVEKVSGSNDKKCATPRGCNIPDWTSPGRTPERYCIASFASGAEVDEPSGSVSLNGDRDAANTAATLEAMALPNANTIRICGRTGKYYELEITGSHGGPLQAYKLHRRYREFASLDQRLRDRLEGLPSLPRKSIFTKHVSPGFLLQRERGLQAFMNAVMEADPNMQDPNVKAFLDPHLQMFPGGDSPSRSILAESEAMSEATGSFRSARQ